MDNFGVKYFNKENEDHILYYLRKYYVVSMDWVGKIYLVLSINWDYEKVHIDICIPDSLLKSLACFQHQKPKPPQYAPYFWTVNAYFQRLQMTPEQ